MSRAARDVRELLGLGLVLSPADAVRALPFRDAVARTWLRQRKLVRSKPELGEYVLWHEVLAALGDAEDDAPPAAKPKPGGKLPRAGIYRRG